VDRRHTPWHIGGRATLLMASIISGGETPTGLSRQPSRTARLGGEIALEAVLAVGRRGRRLSERVQVSLAGKLEEGGRLKQRLKTNQPGLLLITDPGPDPDDVKSLLLAAALHRARQVTFRAAICNGGHQAHARAKLARCLLDHVGARDVPVGVGSEGVAYAPQPHEYSLDGYDDVDESRLLNGESLLLKTIRTSPRKSLRVVLISSLRDFADVARAHEEMVVTAVHSVSVQGGLEPDPETPGAWRPESSVNNGFDMEAAAFVYRFCFEKKIPMTVVSRHAVPLLPMQLAKSFAERTECSVMRYLANAQFKGLEGLWQKICEGKLPARCNKQWFFETFCGVKQEIFEAAGHESLGADADIGFHLNGFVKPYDVVALIIALPLGKPLIASRSAVEINGTIHHLLLRQEHEVDVLPIAELLRDVYHAAVGISVKANAAPTRRGGAKLHPRRASMRLQKGLSLGSFNTRSPKLSEVAKRWIRDSDSSVTTVTPAHRTSEMTRTSAAESDSLWDENLNLNPASSTNFNSSVLTLKETAELLSAALEDVTVRQRWIARVLASAIVPGLLLLSAMACLEVVWAANTDTRLRRLRLTLYWPMGCLLILAVLAPVRPTPAHLCHIRCVTIVNCMAQLVVVGFFVVSLIYSNNATRSLQVWGADAPIGTIRGLLYAYTVVAVLPVGLVFVLIFFWRIPRRLLSALWLEAGLYISINAFLGTVVSGLGLPWAVPLPSPDAAGHMAMQNWMLAIKIAVDSFVFVLGLVFLFGRGWMQVCFERRTLVSGSAASLAGFLGFGSRAGAVDTPR